MVRETRAQRPWLRGGIATVVTMGILGLWACNEPVEPETIAIPGETPAEETQIEGAHDYSFDDDTSLIYVKVFAEPGTSGHDHVMRGSGYTGTLSYDSNNPSSCELDISLAVNSLGVDEDVMREYLDWETLGDGTKNSVKSNMLDEDQLNASAFPTMVYQATGCDEVGGSLTIVGDLTIRGVTRSVSMPTTLVTTADGLSAQGALNFRQTDFGYAPYKLFGYENADEVEMTLLIEAERI